MTTPARMLMYGKEARNRKQEIERQPHTIPNPRNQRPKDKHCGNVYNWLSYGIVGNSVCSTWESCTLAFPCAVNRVIHDSIACYAHFHNACLLVFVSE